MKTNIKSIMAVILSQAIVIQGCSQGPVATSTIQTAALQTELLPLATWFLQCSSGNSGNETPVEQSNEPLIIIGVRTKDNQKADRVAEPDLGAYINAVTDDNIVELPEGDAVVGATGTFNNKASELILTARSGKSYARLSYDVAAESDAPATTGSNEGDTITFKGKGQLSYLSPEGSVTTTKDLSCLLVQRAADDGDLPAEGVIGQDGLGSDVTTEWLWPVVGVIAVVAVACGGLQLACSYSARQACADLGTTVRSTTSHSCTLWRGKAVTSCSYTCN